MFFGEVDVKLFCSLGSHAKKMSDFFNLEAPLAGQVNQCGSILQYETNA